jgi:hypothetical protein
MIAFRRAVFLLAIFAASACESPRSTPPAQLSAATLRRYILGHWFEEAYSMSDSHLEVEYHADGTLSASDVGFAYTPDNRRIPFTPRYEGTWRLDGSRLVHRWKSGSPPAYLFDCDVREATGKKLLLQSRDGPNALIMLYRSLRVGRVYQ